MTRLAAIFAAFAVTTSAAFAQITSTPGPGGIPIAPGAPVHGYTPGGIGIGGGRIAPGPAAAGVPMYRRGPGGVPVLVTPESSGQTVGRGGAAYVGGTSAADVCGGRACLPGGLQLVIDSGEVAAQPSGEIGSMDALRTVLRACWTPPSAQHEMQMSVRFSFRRSGKLIAPPFVTYATRGVSTKARQEARNAITDALNGCAPFRFSPEFGSAIAGKPLSVRFVDRKGAP